MCAQIHFNICKETGVQLDKIHWYEYVPKSVETSQADKVTILWNQQVQTDRTICNNKPDIIICDNEKYKDLTIEIQRMWNVKTKVIPVITGATGTISKKFRKYV